MRNVIEQELLDSEDQYKTIGISVNHVSEADRESLSELAIDESCGMVLERDTGWFIKLYDESDSNNRHSISDDLKSLLESCLSAGYRMVEIDCDAKIYESLPTY
jgi:hypothetical protein